VGIVPGSPIKPANIVNRARTLGTNMARLPAWNQLFDRFFIVATLAKRSTASNGLNQPSTDVRVWRGDAHGSSDVCFSARSGYSHEVRFDNGRFPRRVERSFSLFRWNQLPTRAMSRLPVGAFVVENLVAILVVEDDPLVQSVVEEALAEGGFEVAMASSGEGVPNSIMLAKPFAPAQLVTAVSQLLNSAPPTT
jgi:hypothetical protein